MVEGAGEEVLSEHEPNPKVIFYPFRIGLTYILK